MIYRRSAQILLTWSLLSTWAFAAASVTTEDSSGMAMLDRMTRSFADLSYDGIFVRSYGSNMSSMQIRRTVIDDTEYASLLDLDGDRIEVIRVGGQVICVYPDISFRNEANVLQTPLKKFKELSSERIAQGYDFVIAGEGLVAGRQANRLQLQPKDTYRFAHHFWFDKQTGFLLKHDVLEKMSGQLIERIQFTSLNTSPQLYKKDFVPRMGAYIKHATEAEHKMVEPMWTFSWLPVGFVPVWENARLMDENTSMMVLSDGITSISLFTELSQHEMPLNMRVIGATMAGEKTHQVGDRLYRITAIGEVPDKMIRKLLTSLVPR